ncbi:stimulated by retinoic acid gene 6 protein-like [Mytilus californianus]|uniref:stimulated by retinoic acid gene 6 protein-like n=1 Tax=Mytilus californianus TaxID=6549 RepID=UPI0022485620|nr:stimulated by retinoic acid gene 6 protein-like [Mytilus californianus]XP_052094985.1 stimulated by retinoic acid gene 6 protein-like [Mytilus californianus]
MMKRLNDSAPLRTSPRVIFTFVVSTLILLQLSITLCLLYQPLRRYAVVLVNNLNSTALLDGNLFLQVTDVSFYTSFATSTFIMALYIILIYRSYQRDLRRMYSGDFSFLPKKVKRTDNKDFIASSLRYSGTQIAYMFWCYVILFVVILLLCYILAYLLILPLMDKVSDQLLIGVKAIFPIVAAHYIFQLCQTFLVNRYFLQNHTVMKETSEDLQRVIALKNRKLFSVLMYFMFFFHVIIGFFTCIRRILLGGAIGILTLARIDRSLLPRGYEHLDSGYATYVGLIMLELYHRNPILIVFCEELRQTLMVKDKRKFISLEIPGNHAGYQNSISGSELIQRRKRIQNMWFKALTLINNSSVRRHHDGKIKRLDLYPDRTQDFTK